MGVLSPRLEMPVVSAVALLMLAGCDSRDVESPPPVAVVRTVPRVAATIAPAPRVLPTAIPSPVPTPPTLADMRPRKTFVDPPLPPELLDDGGLRPLPPPTR